LFFVLSTGRSGTQTVARTLSLIPGCLCLHEPEPNLIKESASYRYGEMSAEEVRRILRATRPPTIYHGVYGEANQTLSLLIPELVRVFPEAKFVWLIRNGLDVVASAVGRGWYPTEPAGWKALDQRRRFWVSHRIRGDLCRDLPASQWEAMSTFERCCWYWSYVNRVIEQDLRQHAPDRFRQVKLERIDSELATVARWLGLPTLVLPPSARHNRATGYEVYCWQHWTGPERQHFLHRCGRDMDRLYPCWRNENGEWLGVGYGGASALQQLLTKCPRIARRLNWLHGIAVRGMNRASQGRRGVTSA
jgi:hypothetical protein